MVSKRHRNPRPQGKSKTQSFHVMSSVYCFLGYYSKDSFEVHNKNKVYKIEKFIVYIKRFRLLYFNKIEPELCSTNYSDEKKRKKEVTNNW